jgi:DNA-binding MarR family transcriptional regulator
MAVADKNTHAQVSQALTQELRRTSSGAVLFSQAVADAVGLNPTDVECLDILLDAGPVPAGRLAELTGLTTGAITGVIDRLEKGGYVRRAHDPGDRRKVIVMPVQEQIGRLRSLYDWLVQRMEEIYAGYSAEQLDLITRFIAQANAAGMEAIARLRAGSSPGALRRAEPAAAGKSEGNSFVARLGSVSEGRLLFTRGMTGVEVEGSRDMDDLVRVRFERTTPDVQVQGGIVTVRQRHAFLSGPDSGSVALNASIPWSVEVRSGLSGSKLDLRDVALQELRVKSGTSGLEMWLGRPEGVVPVRLMQGSDKVKIHLVAGAAGRINLKQGGSNLNLDGRRIASSGPTIWHSPDYNPTAGRYEISLHSGVNNLTVDTR